MTGTAAFWVVGGADDAANVLFYPAHVPMRDRDRAGLAFELAPGRPWQWTGQGEAGSVTLADVLAAVSHARITGRPWESPDGLAAVHGAHQAAIDAALAAGDAALAGRLRGEQAEVAAPALVSEEDAAARLGITGHSLNNLRLQYRTVCPPVLIAGERRTRWFWSPAQFSRWEEDRPGKSWRKGQKKTYARARCPACGRETAAAPGPDGTLRAGFRAHKRPDSTEWCDGIPAAAGARQA